jgi:tryptophanyl-tRNA synthetase
MITPLSWLERVPTYKEQIENLKERDLGTYGFLGYPLLQASDIVIYDADFVPVGEDQVPHVELTREVVRRFNTAFFEIKKKPNEKQMGVLRAAFESKGHAAFAADDSEEWQAILKAIRAAPIELRQSVFANAGIHTTDTLTEPGHLLTATPRLPGLDGRRMAKSYGNAIWLSDPPDDVRAKVRNMLTDPQRVKRTDPGRPEVCPVFAWHKLFSAPLTVGKVDADCRTAAIGCVDCKKLMAENLVTWLEPVQARRKEFEAHPQKVWGILDAGGKKAHAAAKRTMKRVRNAIFKWDEARKSTGGS